MKRPGVHLQLPSNHRVIAAKPALPQPVADDCNMRVVFIFLHGKHAPADRLHMKRRKHFSAYRLSVDFFGALAITKDHMKIKKTADGGKR